MNLIKKLSELMKYIKQGNLKEDLFFTFINSYLTISPLDLQKDPIYAANITSTACFGENENPYQKRFLLDKYLQTQLRMTNIYLYFQS